jgi:NADPH:quinone reductase-like Zn-dependent oxidoreductase
MRALLCRSLDGIGSLEVAEVASPTLGSGQVRIGVRASGINFPDILMVEGKYQVRPELPFIPGLEVAGVVLECAAGVEHVRPGDRVLAFARRGGGHAEEVVVPGAIVTPIPDAMDFVTAPHFPLLMALRTLLSRTEGISQPGKRSSCSALLVVSAWRRSRSASSWALGSWRLRAVQTSSPLPGSTAPTRPSTTVSRICGIRCAP